MEKYHKIQTLYKRDTKGKLLEGQWSTPEFYYLSDNDWVFTEKVDGTNIRIGWDGSSRVIGGRGDNSSIPVPLLGKLLELFPENKLETVLGSDEINPPFILCGEGYGPKIQKIGGNYRDDVSFVLFDVSIGGVWLQRADVEDIAGKFELDAVPIIGKGNVFQAVEAVMDGGFTSTWGDFTAEGIVLRPEVELCTRRGERVIAKIKVKDFAGRG